MSGVGRKRRTLMKFGVTHTKSGLGQSCWTTQDLAKSEKVAVTEHPIILVHHHP